jgi:hypothetical protein
MPHPQQALATRENGTKVYRIILHFWILLKNGALWTCGRHKPENETSMRTLDSTLSLIRRGSYELRVMKLCSQATEELWLELFDHDRRRTVDSYRGRDLEDIAVAARSLSSKMLRGARIAHQWAGHDRNGSADSRF